MGTEEEMLFRNFLEKDREAFLSIGRERQCQPGESVVRDAAAGSSLFITMEGEASVWKKNVRVAIIRKGSVFGESALFQNQQRIATIRAEVPMRVLEFRRPDILTFFKWKEERLFKVFVLNIITILLGKLGRANERIASMASSEQALSGFSGGGM
ncbi:MAG: cyclic nucleotide-binding domain-containing protein [Candidatus Latescibacteria bacterium]|nr:cyclic nucleotide-binding domain-containing protein [Candidatus Latescibacterota bacterium]MCK5327386.1 cyclic nucleotide-binding domain-containing protein [Candidatus Latescibacterota bacterium]MCK5381085.1 cyclic nucleotide-binding domain-containing protein [Candidatus Latescibacterota bacterium]MCK5525849.1 cyclic nucleotide-binding domain-containing protein [Candidatus Latescibacterota bacterium]MCK5734016.1 cyclic nucleotide-binding domain-containing protein [Candidatus Latescibacterota